MKNTRVQKRSHRFEWNLISGHSKAITSLSHALEFGDEVRNAEKHLLLPLLSRQINTFYHFNQSAESGEAPFSMYQIQVLPSLIIVLSF